MLLEATDVTVCYETAMVLNKASVKVDTGELVAMVGANGAGKTTLLRAICGLVRWEIKTLRGTTLSDITFEGDIVFNGENINKLDAHEIARRGLVLCPERGRPFRELTVRENLEAGGHLCRSRRQLMSNLAKVYELFPRLKEREKQIAGTLSGGERQMLAVGRTLMHEPKLLCIDEPSTGLAPMVKDDLFKRVKAIYEMGITIFLVEQDVSFAFDLSNRNYLMSRGRVISEGSAEQFLSDETIRKTYLGM